jgi:hypothetical protein
MLVRADGMDEPASGRGSDIRQFTDELRSSGALKFYEETEKFLRTGQFERAFSRFLFLKAHIRGQALYVGLNASVDQRLQFLRSQMRLGKDTAYKKFRKRVRRRVRRVQPPSPPPSDQKAAKTPTPTKSVSPVADKAKPLETGKKPPVADSPPAATTDQTYPSPKVEKEPPPEEDQEEKPEKKPSPPPPSTWQRLKRKLQFWK